METIKWTNCEVENFKTFTTPTPRVVTTIHKQLKTTLPQAEQKHNMVDNPNMNKLIGLGC